MACLWPIKLAYPPRSEKALHSDGLITPRRIAQVNKWLQWHLSGGSGSGPQSSYFFGVFLDVAVAQRKFEHRLNRDMIVIRDCACVALIARPLQGSLGTTETRFHHADLVRPKHGGANGAAKPHLGCQFALRTFRYREDHWLVLLRTN